MAKDFKALLRSLSEQLEQQEVEVIVKFAHLPEEFKKQTPVSVLDRLAENGKFSARNLEIVMDAMKEIGRNDLFKEVNTFKKKSKKKLSENNSDSSDVYFNFDVAEIEAAQLRNTLLSMEGSDAIAGVKRIEEVYNEAKDNAENLLRLIRRANCLTRTLRPATATEDRSPPPTSTASTDSANHPEQFSPVSGLRELLTRKKGPKSLKLKKEKGKQKEASSEEATTAPQNKLKRGK